MIEGITVPLIAGGGGEHLGIPRPSHALIPLGAVRGDIQEIRNLPPLDVGQELIDQGIPGFQKSCQGELRVKHQGGKILCVQMGNALHLHIPEAIEGKLRLQHMGGSIGNVDVLRFGGAQIVPVEIAVLENFAELQMNLRSLRFLHPQAEDSRHILPHVNDRLPSRGMENLFYGKGLPHRNRGAVSFRQRPLGGLHRDGFHRCHLRQGIVPALAVVDVGKENGGAGHFPAFVGSDDLLTAVRIGNVHLGQQLPAVAVVGLLLPIRPEAALVPAIAQLHGQCPRSVQLLRHIIGLVLNPIVVVVAERCQVFVSDLLPVPAGFIQAQTADV